MSIWYKDYKLSDFEWMKEDTMMDALGMNFVEIGVDDDEFMVLDYDEHYLDKDTEFWFDNRSSETNWVLSHDSSESYEMDDKSVSAVVLRFKIKYKNEIENLKKFYEEVSVGYYVLGYHM